MIPILFSATATTFTSQGLGTLSDAVSCEVHEEINGEFELEMTYPTTGGHYSEIGLYSIIVVKLPYLTDKQAFRVYKVGTVLCGLTTFYARHISYDMKNYAYAAQQTLSSLTNALSNIESNSKQYFTSAIRSPFELSADFTSTLSFRNENMPNERDALLGENSILSVYGGEWEWNNYSAVLRSRRGADNGYTVKYGKNLLSLKKDTTSGSDYAAVTAIYRGPSTSETGIINLGTARTELAEDMPVVTNLIVDATDAFGATASGAPTIQELVAYAENYADENGLNEWSEPSIDLAFIDDSFYNSVSIGDTVHVICSDTNLDLRAVDIKYDVLLDRYTDIKLGKVQTTLADTITAIAGTVSKVVANQRVYSYMGQKSLSVSSDFVKLLTTSEINTIFGVNDASGDNTVISVANANGDDITSHIDGCTYLPSSDAWYAVFDRSTSGTVTINYLISYRKLI